MNKDQKTSKYENALKHVTRLKEFYQHLLVYFIFIILWLIFKENIVEFIVGKTDNIESGFLTWLRLNLLLVPVIWGFGILLQWLYIRKFRLSIFNKWEEKKIEEFMSKENKEKTNTKNWE